MQLNTTSFAEVRRIAPREPTLPFVATSAKYDVKIDVKIVVTKPDEVKYGWTVFDLRN